MPPTNKGNGVAFKHPLQYFPLIFHRLVLRIYVSTPPEGYSGAVWGTHRPPPRRGVGTLGGWRGAPFRSPPSPGRGLRFTRLALLWLGAGLGADLLGQTLQVGVLRKQRSHGWRFGGRAGLAPGSYSRGGEPGRSVPRRHRQPQTYTLPLAGATLSSSAALAGNQHVGRRGQPSAEQPARDARLTRWLQRKRHGGRGAKHYGAGRGARPGHGRCSVPVRGDRNRSAGI